MNMNIAQCEHNTISLNRCDSLIFTSKYSLPLDFFFHFKNKKEWKNGISNTFKTETNFKLMQQNIYTIEIFLYKCKRSFLLGDVRQLHKSHVNHVNVLQK